MKHLKTQSFAAKKSEVQLLLRLQHNYFCQIQGQMAIGKQPWCDFVIWTIKDIHVERVMFDEVLWGVMLCKLSSFYDFCYAPEILCPVHVSGLPLRDLSKNNIFHFQLFILQFQSSISLT